MRRSVRFPPGYGEPGDELLPWTFAEERLTAAPNYWITTVTPEGRPHTRPLDGVWVDGALCFGGSDQAVWVRNLNVNPAVAVNLASNNDVVILEGDAELVSDANHPLAGPSLAASRAKYPSYYGPDAAFRPFWAIRPRVAYAWSLATFPRGAARWTFEA